MAQWNRIVKTLSVILPAGAFGASVLLALASSDAKAATNPSTATQATADRSVSTRLLEIRDGVSNLSGSASDPSASDAKAAPAWWGNGGWGRWRPGWGNGGLGWRNGWHNGGWGNGGNWGNGGGGGNGGNWGNGGGWGNGGWHNGWHNFWHNW
jgi:rSAM-associated Gly-rich repeat protein